MSTPRSVAGLRRSTQQRSVATATMLDSWAGSGPAGAGLAGNVGVFGQGVGVDRKALFAHFAQRFGDLAAALREQLRAQKQPL